MYKGQFSQDIYQLQISEWSDILFIIKEAQPTNPVGRAYGRQPKTVAKRYIIAPKVSTFAL